MIEEEIIQSAVHIELNALKELNTQKFYQDIKQMISLIQSNQSVITLGMGKSGIIAEYCASILSSVGIDAVYEDIFRLLHGEMIKYSEKNRQNKLIMIFSKSGNGDEYEKFFSALEPNNFEFVLVTSAQNSFLSQRIKHIIRLTVKEESDIINILPLSTSLLYFSFCNIVASVLLNLRFSKKEYIEKIIENHKCGYLGKYLAKEHSNEK